jgi:hypothetical protein
MLASTQVVNAWANAGARARRARWDFEEENPLRDARGFELGRDVADSTLLTDEDLGLANVILTNGARLYVDHAHPEYSTPECTGPRDVLVWDKAGEIVMRRAAALASAQPNTPPLLLYKNNVDNKGAELRRARELPDGAGHAFRRHRGAPDPVLRDAPGDVRGRSGRPAPGRQRVGFPDQPAG